jgi:hypothetical protein
MARTFELRGPSGAVSVEVLRYENPHSPDATDRNWLTCQITAEFPPFLGSFGATLLTDDLSDLRRDLRELLAGVRAEISFETFEQWLTFNISKRPGGQVEINGALKPSTAARPVLSFSFASDASYLDHALSSLDALEGDFPVVGGRHL